MTNNYLKGYKHGLTVGHSIKNAEFVDFQSWYAKKKNLVDRYNKVKRDAKIQKEIDDKRYPIRQSGLMNESDLNQHFSESGNRVGIVGSYFNWYDYKNVFSTDLRKFIRDTNAWAIQLGFDALNRKIERRFPNVNDPEFVSDDNLYQYIDAYPTMLFLGDIGTMLKKYFRA